MLDQLDAQITRARELLDEGDRVLIPLKGSCTFLAGANDVRDIVLNIPTDGDFFMERLNLYAASKLNNLGTQSLSERTFRPCDGAATNEMDRQISANASGFQPLVDFAYEIILPSGPYQNAPMAALQSFSNRYGVSWTVQGTQASVVALAPYSAWVGGMAFAGESRIPAGTTVTIRVTPTYTLASEDTDYVREFRVTAVATGCKRVRSFI